MEEYFRILVYKLDISHRKQTKATALGLHIHVGKSARKGAGKISRLGGPIPLWQGNRRPVLSVGKNYSNLTK
jgi:hypothetical protein